MPVPAAKLLLARGLFLPISFLPLLCPLSARPPPSLKYKDTEGRTTQYSGMTLLKICVTAIHGSQSICSGDYVMIPVSSLINSPHIFSIRH